jgi:DNA repair exonuclease SbcCD ATPase subunit
MNIKRFRRTIDSALARSAALTKSSKDLSARADAIHERAVLIPEMLEVLQQFNHQLQSQTFTHFEQVVSSCLAAIFDEPYTFHIVPEIKRQQLETRFEFRRAGEAFDPLSEVEGGVLDVASFALRLAYLSITSNRKLIVLDEPFKWVDVVNRGRLKSLLEMLCERFNFQIIIVTHLPELIDEHAITL